MRDFQIHRPAGATWWGGCRLKPSVAHGEKSGMRALATAFLRRYCATTQEPPRQDSTGQDRTPPAGGDTTGQTDRQTGQTLLDSTAWQWEPLAGCRRPRSVAVGAAVTARQAHAKCAMHKSLSDRPASSLAGRAGHYATTDSCSINLAQPHVLTYLK